MRVLALSLALLTTAAASPSSEVVRGKRCVKPGADHTTSRPTGPPRARPLKEMPSARPVLTVFREVDGCHVLLVKDRGRIIEEQTDAPERRRIFTP